MRLIDADALKNKLCEDCFGDCTRDCYEAHLIKAQPTIEVAPVRRGRWLAIKEKAPWLVCSECGTYLYDEQKRVAKYCYNCGAKMEEEEL